MPTATPFTALGRGNGFPFCLAKIDVTNINSIGSGLLSPYDQGSINWMTLGGVSSGSASQSQINLSLRNAMKLFYNLHSVQAGTFTATSEITDNSLQEGNQYGTISGFPTDSSSANGTNAFGIFQKRDSFTQEISDLPPIKRACKESSSISVVSFGGERDPSNFHRPQRSSAQIDGGFSIFKMYNGSIDDESNFVGYGCFRPVARAVAISQASARGTGGSNVDMRVEVQVSSILLGDTGSGTDPGDSVLGGEFDEKISYTTLEGIPFVAKTKINVFSTVDESADIHNLDNNLSASQLSGTVSSSFSLDYNDDGEFTAAGNGSVEASISGLNFYTY